MNSHHDFDHIDETGLGPLFGITASTMLTVLVCVLLLLYIGAVIRSNQRYKRWPRHRTICWCVGTICALMAVAGPLASSAHTNFTAHMFSHLLLGMLAPLCMVMAAPMTLLLRTLNVPWARSVSRYLKSWPSRLVTHPIVATTLNIGGLWLLYTTEIYAVMHEHNGVHFIVHLHVLIAGYLFTVSMLSVEPIPHRKSFPYRAVVLIVALAGHGILSKYIYTHPPEGVPLAQAELGSMVMYYGGDLIDAIIIFFLCLQWYQAVRPRVVQSWAAE